MKTIIINEKDRSDKFPELFGKHIFKGMPLFIYAENLFYNGMKQMIPSYDGGYFDFIKIVESDVEIEELGFFPLITQDKIISITSPFGISATLSYKAGCLVVWIFVLEQIANNVSGDVRERIFRTIQDVKYCYSTAIDESGNKLFSESDCGAIYELFD